MRVVALVVALLACAGQARKVSLKEPKDDALSSLAALLYASDPAAAFNPSTAPVSPMRKVNRAGMRPVAGSGLTALKSEGRTLSKTPRSTDVNMYVGEITDQMIYNALLLAAAAGAMALRLGLTLKESYDNDPFALD
mmetsp:Transcript_129952/g.229678  ORF Transcript_129952/g.229678 Transcript_129952/m.229678 type:complete len:137 (+) Transcript_129952:81-491(+)